MMINYIYNGKKYSIPNKIYIINNSFYDFLNGKVVELVKNTKNIKDRVKDRLIINYPVKSRYGFFLFSEMDLIKWLSIEQYKKLKAFL